MNQRERDNIIPFYGVSTTVADFCLVFPWYENGNIMGYLKKRPGTNRFCLVCSSSKPHTPDSHFHPRIVIGRSQWIVLLT